MGIAALSSLPYFLYASLGAYRHMREGESLGDRTASRYFGIAHFNGRIFRYRKEAPSNTFIDLNFEHGLKVSWNVRQT